MKFRNVTLIVFALMFAIAPIAFALKATHSHVIFEVR